MDSKSRPISTESDSTSDANFAPREAVCSGLWKTRLAARLADELTPRIIARFHEKYDKSERGCWLWKFATYENGYGQFMVSRVGGRQLNIQAHRLAYLLAHGALIDGLVVMHSCDTPACVNPDHLSQDTQGANVRDGARKGRYSLPKPSLQKISDAQVIDILASTETHAVEAKRYGVTVPCISKIRNGSRRRKAA